MGDKGPKLYYKFSLLKKEIIKFPFKFRFFKTINKLLKELSRKLKIENFDLKTFCKKLNWGRIRKNKGLQF